MIDALPLERFQHLVARYGADPDRWPDDLRAGAVATLAGSDAARIAWRDAAALDADLDRLPEAVLPPRLAERVTAIADTEAAPDRSVLSGAVRHAIPYATAAAIALGVGLATPSPFRDIPDQGSQSALAAIEPAGAEASGLDLTALALVDASPFTDDVSTSSANPDNESPLAGIPLL